MLKNILLQFTDPYNMTCVYCREEDKLFVCIKTTLYSQKKIKTLYLRLNAYDLTSNFWIYFPSKVSSHNSWKTAEISKMLSLTVQQFKHNALSPEFLGAVSSLNLLEAPSFFRVFDFFLSFLNHRVFDKFIQLKSCVRSASRYFYCFNGFTDS